MADKIEVYSWDANYVQIVGDRSMIQELGDYFTFEVPGAKFMPAYIDRLWDGKIRLLDIFTQRLYKGLIPYIKKFCSSRNYELFIEEGLELDYGPVDMKAFMATLNLQHVPYDFQEQYINYAVTNGRAAIISPTSSGKSLIAYCLIRWYLEHTEGKILLCAPTIDLVNQLTEEFHEYNTEWNAYSKIHKIYYGQDKQTDKRVVVSTWQSVFEQSKAYFKQFDVIIIDEAHGIKADSIKSIFHKAPHVEHRFGLTGTLEETECHKLVIEGLTGIAVQYVTTKDLIDRGITSEIDIRCMILKYDEATRKANKNLDYQGECDFIVHNDKRNKFIAKIAASIKDKNMLILTDYHAKKPHIALIKAEIEKICDKEVLVVHGDIPADERKRIRKYAETKNNLIIIATFGTYSTGINIKNLQYVMFATSSKSLIKILQSIGRGLRRDGKENKLILFDLVDVFGYQKKKNNLTRHFFERVKIYIKSQFPYKSININI